MDIHRSDNPAQALGEQITNSIAKHSGDALCLLAGGSSLDVVEYIKLPLETERRTIFMMGDERVSRERDVNNYLQLESRYPDHGILEHVVKSVPAENESQNAFCDRMKQTLLDTIKELNNPNIICILGVGADGHTAGIFPMDRHDFEETYPNDSMYVKVRRPEPGPDQLRTTIAPDWILEHVNELYMYVISEEKAHILYMLIGEHKSIYERPAEVVKQHMKARIYTDQEL